MFVSHGKTLESTYFDDRSFRLLVNLNEDFDFTLLEKKVVIYKI